MGAPDKLLPFRSALEDELEQSLQDQHQSPSRERGGEGRGGEGRGGEGSKKMGGEEEEGTRVMDCYNYK